MSDDNSPVFLDRYHTILIVASCILFFFNHHHYPHIENYRLGIYQDTDQHDDDDDHHHHHHHHHHHDHHHHHITTITDWESTKTWTNRSPIITSTHRTTPTSGWTKIFANILQFYHMNFKHLPQVCKIFANISEYLTIFIAFISIF